jgi:hypothetical protein
MSVFKHILVASKVEEAVIDTLVKWLPTYVREVERQLGLDVGVVDTPAYYTNRNSFDVQAGEPFPRVVVVSPGLAGAPLANGAGQYRATWRVGAGVAIAASTELRANLEAKVYGAAVRSILLHKQSLGGLANSVRWIDESYDDLPIPSQSKLYKAAGVYFEVDCEDVVTKWAGPEKPDDEPYAYGTAQSVIIDIVKIPVPDELPVLSG